MTLVFDVWNVYIFCPQLYPRACICLLIYFKNNWNAGPFSYFMDFLEEKKTYIFIYNFTIDDFFSFFILSVLCLPGCAFNKAEGFENGYYWFRCSPRACICLMMHFKNNWNAGPFSYFMDFLEEKKT
jgi:hypothetical protein